MSEPSQFTGALLHGTFRLERLIGEGGMGAVYLASHNRLARQFAIKVMRHKTWTEPTIIARFKREAQVTSTLGNPHIVDVVDFNVTDQGVPYIVMELLEGEDLQQRLDRVGRMKLPAVLRVFEQVVAALHVAHGKGIVHRDLKPSNIFICRLEGGEEQVKVVDFGISKILGDRHTSITEEDTLVGTPHYMAPEQAQRGKTVDHRVDVFAVGVMVYQALSGYLPFAGPRALGVLYQIVHEEPPPLDNYIKDLPDGVASAVLRALAKDPAERWPSIRAFWIELANASRVDRRELSKPYLLRHDSDEEIEENSTAAALGDTRPLTPPDKARITTLGGTTGEVLAPSTQSSRRALALVGVLLVAIAGLVVVVIADISGQPARPPQSRSAAPEVDIMPPVTTVAPVARDAAVAPDATAPVAPDATATARVQQNTQNRVTRGLWLRSAPNGARVRVVGGRFLGRTPLRGVAIGGAGLDLQISAPGHKPRRLRVSSGTRPVKLGKVPLTELEPAVLQLNTTIDGVPVKAIVYWNRSKVGEAPVRLTGQRPGKHVVEARYEGRSVRRTVTLRPGKTLKIRLTLK
jgi:serine/threonine-protein kinase